MQSTKLERHIRTAFLRPGHLSRPAGSTRPVGLRFLSLAPPPPPPFLHSPPVTLTFRGWWCYALLSIGTPTRRSRPLLVTSDCIFPALLGSAPPPRPPLPPAARPMFSPRPSDTSTVGCRRAAAPQPHVNGALLALLGPQSPHIARDCHGKQEFHDLPDRNHR